MTVLGTLGSPGRARIDPRGHLAPEDETWGLDWWIGGDDRWYRPAREPAVRQRAIESTPVVETSLHVPNGNLIQRAYGVSGPAGLVVVEFQNRSPAAVVVALHLAAREGRRAPRSVALDGTTLVVDGRPALVLPFAPSRWVVARAGEPAAHDTVVGGGASLGPFPSVEDPRGLEVVLMYPLAHVARMRVALALGDEWPEGVALAELPDPDEVARGWQALLDRGTRVVLPDATLADRVERARAAVLLDADGGPDQVAALEDWGFDTEAEYAWHGLRLRDRRAARRRPEPRATAWPEDDAAFLVALRQVLVRDAGPGIELLADHPDAWLGQGCEVHDAPTRHGLVSFALRWHGERPALLWEVSDPRPDLVITCPGLDPSWSSRTASGEALLAPPVSRPAAG